MLLEENKAIVRRMIEAVNTQNLASLDELVATNFVYHTSTQQIRGLGVMKQVVEEEIKGFPDLYVTFEDIIAERYRIRCGFVLKSKRPNITANNRLVKKKEG